MNNKERPNKERPLTPKEKAFCREYAISGNGSEAIRKAGYKYKNDNSTGNAACELLKKPRIKKEIERILKPIEKRKIATAQEVMEYFTKVMNGEIKDQFGLEAPLSERTKAATELAKRTVDIDNRIKGTGDTNLTIKVDWKKD